jgi:hypothetical protein
MTSLPAAIIFINGDITYPATPPPYPPSLDVFIGSQPNLPTSYIASASELTTIQLQLFIDQTLTKEEFDSRVAVVPDYPTIIHLQGLRVLVILPSLHDLVNRHHADIVMFLHQGLADIETNRFWESKPQLSHTYCPTPTYPETYQPAPFSFTDGCTLGSDQSSNFAPQFQNLPEPFHDRRSDGPPGKSYELQRLTVYELLRAKGCRGSAFLPFEALSRCDDCHYPFFCDRCHKYDGQSICSDCRCENKCGCNLIDNQGIRFSMIYLPNCENENNNFAFLNRK